MIDQETAIMHKLQNAILESYRTLIEVQDLCAELDWWGTIYASMSKYLRLILSNTKIKCHFLKSAF